MTTESGSSAAGDAARLAALEELFTHLDGAVQDLHQVVLEQNKQLLALERRLEKLTQRLQWVEQAAVHPDEGEEPPPPHY